MGPGIRIHWLVLGIVVAAATSLPGQNGSVYGDFHTLQDEGRRLYAISAFAHGHRHGYEEGFRAADLEIHVGRLQRTLRDKDIPKFDYRDEYGDRTRFKQGFIQGFRAGYSDSFFNRSFRLVEWADEIPPFSWMSDLPQAAGTNTIDPKMRASFDTGVQQGYQAAVQTAAPAAEAPQLAKQAEKACREQPIARDEGFCDGYTQGFLLGAERPDPALRNPAGLAQKSSRSQDSSQPQ
jgi:hypothetical protein